MVVFKQKNNLQRKLSRYDVYFERVKQINVSNHVTII